MEEPATGGPSRRFTINRIAREGGVSLTTVSRALNERPGIRPETRQRILAIAQDLGYTPRAIARSLVTQRTHTIALVVRTHLDLWGAQVILPMKRWRTRPATRSLSAVTMPNRAGSAPCSVHSMAGVLKA